MIVTEEMDRPLPGRFVAFRADMREVGGIFVYREAFNNGVAPTLRVSAECGA